MKGIFKFIGLMVMLLAIAGGVYLTFKNQETRRGAAANATSTSVLPSTIATEAGKNFDVHVWVNTGAATDKLVGAVFVVKFDPTKVTYVSSSVIPVDYTILNTVTNEAGKLTFKIVSMKTEKAGAVDLVKLTFTSLGGSGKIGVEVGGKIMVSGQGSVWDIATNNSGSYTAAPAVTVTSSFDPPTAIKDGEITAYLSANLGQNKVSSIDIKALFSPTYFDILSVTPAAGAKVLTNNFNVTQGVVNLSLYWDSPYFTNVNFATVKLRTKKIGAGVFSYTTAKVSGFDENNSNVAFKVLLSGARLNISNILPILTPTPTAIVTVVPETLSCVAGSEEKLVSDDFSGETFDTQKWWTWTNNGGTVGQSNGQAISYLPGTTGPDSKSVSFGPNNMGVVGDFIYEVTLKDHSTVGDKSESVSTVGFANSDWTRAVQISKVYNNQSGLIIGWADVGTSSWKSESTNVPIGHNIPVKVKIERTGGTFKVSYDKLDGSGYKLAKQLDNYYASGGGVNYSLSNWSPDFPQTSAKVDDVRINACVISPPKNLKATCLDNGNKVTLSWDAVPNASEYGFRLDETTNNTASCQDGWFCTNTTDASSQVSLNTNTYNILPNKQYNWWVHSINNDQWSAAKGGESFTCPGNGLTGTPVPTAEPTAIITRYACNSTNQTCSLVANGPFFNLSSCETACVQPDGTDFVLNYKVSLANVNPNNAKCMVNPPMKIRVMANGKDKTYEGVIPQSSEAVGNKLVFSGSLNLVGFSEKNGVAAFISGPKHLQMKYGINNQTSTYDKAGGELILTNGLTPVYDFSGYSILVGDVVSNDSQTSQDGNINGVDFAYVKSKALIHETVAEGGSLRGDLDGNCQVNSNDVNVMKISLQDKQGQLY